MEHVSGMDLGTMVGVEPVCCGGLVQLAAPVDQMVTAALSKAGAWLKGGYVWIVAAVGALPIALRCGWTHARDGRSSRPGYHVRPVA